MKQRVVPVEHGAQSEPSAPDAGVQLIFIDDAALRHPHLGSPGDATPTSLRATATTAAESAAIDPAGRLALPPSAGDGRAALSHGDTSDLMLLRLLQWYADRLTGGWSHTPAAQRLPQREWKGRRMVRSQVIRTMSGPFGRPGVYIRGAASADQLRLEPGRRLRTRGDAAHENPAWRQIEPGVYGNWSAARRPVHNRTDAHGV